MLSNDQADLSTHYNVWLFFQFLQYAGLVALQHPHVFKHTLNSVEHMSLSNAQFVNVSAQTGGVGGPGGVGGAGGVGGVGGAGGTGATAPHW